MIHFTRWAALAFTLVGLLIGFTSVSAQENLLQDPSFEGPYVSRGRPDLNTPAAWGLWVADGPRGYEWQNRPDRVFAFPHPAGPQIHSGGASQNINGGYVTFTAAVFQQVTVPNRANLVASAWAWLKTCNLPKDGSGNIIGDNCGSAVESGAYVRVGVDPDGGTNPASPTIIWSGNIAPHDRWEQASVSATANGTLVTMFIWVSQAWPADLNNVYFDDASLTVGGAGGSSPAGSGGSAAATAVPVFPTAAMVVPQAPQPDGSIVHRVQAGDTMSGISYAYGVPVSEIMELNNMRSSRFIFVGQELIIAEAGSARRPTAPPSSDIGPTPMGMRADPTATPRPR